MQRHGGGPESAQPPDVINYSLDIQKAITNNVSLDIGYVGNHGTKLIGALDINQPVAHLVTVPGVNGGNPFSVGPGYTAAGLAAGLPLRLRKPARLMRPWSRRPWPFTQFPYFKFIDEFGNYDTSNYNGLQAVLTARNFHEVGGNPSRAVTLIRMLSATLLTKGRAAAS